MRSAPQTRFSCVICWIKATVSVSSLERPRNGAIGISRLTARLTDASVYYVISLRPDCFELPSASALSLLADFSCFLVQYIDLPLLSAVYYVRF